MLVKMYLLELCQCMKYLSNQESSSRLDRDRKLILTQLKTNPFLLCNDKEMLTLTHKDSIHNFTALTVITILDPT